MPFCLNTGVVGGERAGLLVRVGQLARRDLARLDVGLVERIDADHRAGDGGRDLEAEEFLREMSAAREADAHHRLAGALERVDRLVLRGVGAARRRADR